MPRLFERNTRWGLHFEAMKKGLKMSDEIKDYTETVSVRLTKAQVERLRGYAFERGISQSDVIRQWVDDCDVMPVLSEPLKEYLRLEAEAIRRGTLGGSNQTAHGLVESKLKWVYGSWWGIPID